MAAAILITGAAGFIGSHLVGALLQNNRRIVAVDNFDKFYPRFIKERNFHEASHENLKNVTLIEGDIRDPSLYFKLKELGPYQMIIHLAARAGVRPSLADPALYADVNINGSVRLLDFAQKENIKRIIFASSSSVYGNNIKVPFSESDPVDAPISPYAATKRAGELLCHTFHHLYGINILCLRFFTVYGPRQRPDLAIHKFTQSIFNNEPITLYGDGNSQRDYTYIDDILNGLIHSVHLLENSNQPLFEILNLGESRTVSLTELVQLIEKALGKKAVLKWQPEQPGDVKRTFADLTRARSILKYDPKTPIEQGIPQFVEWFAKHQHQASPKASL